MKKNIKIAFYDSNVLHYLKDPLHPTGGAAKQVIAWIKGLSELGYSTTLIGSHNDPALFSKDNNVFVSYIDNKGVRVFRYFYVRIPGILKALVKSKCDYVYYGVPGHFTGLLSILTKLCGKKFILRISNDYLVDIRYKQQTDMLRYFFYKIAFLLSDSIICQNEYQYNILKVNYSKKTKLISNPFLGSVEQKGVQLCKRNGIAWIATIQHQKNILLLYDIALKMPEIKFTIAGNISNKLSVLENECLNKLQMLPNVEMLGFIDKNKVNKLLAESVILLNTSYYEGFSNTFLEAFSVGTPVFTLSHNDPGSIIRNYKIGLIYDNVESFKDQYKKLVSSDSLYLEYSNNCLEYLKKNHQLILQTKELLNAIRSKK
ncbi:MAG: glycosyltransferase family 4 protein [Flavobacteriaceae bacterium]|nr:glycosyltransferase family 4 protein [Flavobacteriaceae bacterium]